MTARKAANGRSTIYQETDGSWRGEVSLGVDAKGKRLRRKVRGQTQAVVAKKVRAIERERDAGVRRVKAKTVASWLDEWIGGRSMTVRPKTISGYQVDVKHIVRTLGRVRIEQLTPEQVEAMYRDCLAHGLATGSVHHIRRTFSAAMTTAVDRKHIMDNPVRLANCPTYVKPKIVPYTAAEAQKIAAAAVADRNGARWLMQLELGARQGEMLGLVWHEDIDLDGGWVEINEQLQRVPVQHGCRPLRSCGLLARSCPQRRGGGLHRMPVKSDAGQRRLKLSDELVAALRRTRVNQRRDQLRAGSWWQGGDWVFCDELGRPYNSKRDIKLWKQFCESAGVPARRTHDLRHTTATLLLAAGVTDSVVSRTLGHTDVRMTAQYAHIVDPTREMVADTMSSILRAERG